MKRLLLVCGLMALLVASSASAHVRTDYKATLVANCGACIAGSTVSFTGSGYDQNRTLEASVAGPTGSHDYALSGTADSPGNIAFSLPGSAFSTSGSYTVYVAETWGLNIVWVSTTTFALN